MDTQKNAKSSETTNIVDSKCSVCGAAVRGEGIVWEQIVGDKEALDRVFKTEIAHKGGYVCLKCGKVLCSKTHRKEVEKTSRLHGYMNSPCPGCGEPLFKGFIVVNAPEGTVFPSDAESASTQEGPPADESAPKAQTSEVFGWKDYVTKDGAADFACPHCSEPHTIQLKPFENPPPEGIEGFSDKKEFVRPNGLCKILSFVVGVATFIFIYRAILGDELIVTPIIIVPSIVAVMAFSLSNFIFSAIPLIRGIKIPVYGSICNECKKEIILATDGNRFALQVKKKDT